MNIDFQFARYPRRKRRGMHSLSRFTSPIEWRLRSDNGTVGVDGAYSSNKIR
jgi:hypothetical protein